MRKSKMLFVFIFCLSFSHVFSQKSELTLFFLTDNAIKGQQKFAKEYNIPKFDIIYQQFFLTNNKLDKEKLRKEIETRFPSKKAQGICVLDWEGDPIATFRDQSDKTKFDSYKKEFIEAIKFAKKLRPNVKWGYYHLLHLTYSGEIATFREQNSNLEDIIREQDFIAPSLYVYDPEERFQKGNLRYMRNKLLQALEMGQKYNIPVYPFVWHRTPSREKNAGYELIPVKYFQETFDLITNTEYKGVKSKGILWWHSEGYFYRNRKKYSIAEKEYKNVTDIDGHQYKILQTYFNSIKEYIN